MKKQTLLFFVLSFSISTWCHAQYTDIVSFNGATPPAGSSPYGDPIRIGNLLYGMTNTGGANSYGTIFSVDTNGNNYTDLYDFTGGTGGANPYGTLTASVTGDTLFGMTYNGGLSRGGNVFSITITGTNYLDIFNFSSTTGEYPYGQLTLSATGDTLFGMTSYGGQNKSGNIFSVKSNGSNYHDMLDFNVANGAYAYGSLIRSGYTLYGTTSSGGLDSLGNIFSINTNGNGYKDIHDFSGTDIYPFGSLTLSGNTLYGMTSGGGGQQTGQYGNVFSISTGGTNYTNLWRFDAGGDDNGSYPNGSLTLSGTKLYGVTYQGGIYGMGNIFSISTGGTNYTNLFNFNGANGGNPWGEVIVSRGALYGMAPIGGLNNMGVLYALDTDLNVSIASLNITCNGSNNGIAAAITMGGTAPFTYSWSNGQTTARATGLSTGTYKVYVRDAYNYLDSAVVTITQPAALTATASTTADVNCNILGSASTTVSGGTLPYTYAWTGGGGNSDTATGLLAGTYTLTVTDSNGCTSNSSIVITQPVNAIVASASTIANNFCNGDDNGIVSSTVSGGALPYTYSWSGGGGSNATASGLSAGTYTLTVSDNNGCTRQPIAIVHQPSALVGSAYSTSDTLNKCKGSIYVIAGGGSAPYTYMWQTASAQTTTHISNQCPGTYCCLITDHRGCTTNACQYIFNYTGIDNITAGAPSIKAFPNPNNGKFEIQMDNGKLDMENEKSVIEIYDVLGKKVYSQLSIFNSPLFINLSSQPNGLYLYRVIAGDGNLIGEGKVIIQK